MNIKQDMSAGFNRKWVLEVNNEELEYIAGALSLTTEYDCGSEELRQWCILYSTKIYKILDR